MSVTSFRADLGTPGRSAGAERPRQERGPNGRSERAAVSSAVTIQLQSVVPSIEEQPVWQERQADSSNSVRIWVLFGLLGFLPVSTSEIQ